MKRFSKKISIALILLLAISLVMTACSNQQANPEGETEPDEAKTRTIVDMAQRELEVPEKITKVFSVSPVGTIITYTFDPDLLIGWNYDLREVEKEFFPEKYQKLPNLGGWYAKNTGSTEEILKAAPDVILSMGAVNETEISLAERIQEQLNIPVILIDGELTKLDKAYEFLGELFNRQEDAEKFATYCRNTVDEIVQKAKDIPEDKKVRVYYAEGPDGLQTDPPGSRHTELLDLVGAINVADVGDKGGAGMTEVSLEQVLKWDPDMIISWNRGQGGYFEGILSDPNWAEIKAVKNKEVFEIPCAPFNWFDRPPSVNRIIGLKWVANLLYPEIFPYDMEEEAKEFYSMFYHHELTDEQLHKLLDTALRK
mgnify:CR=1 FL=1